MQAHANLVRHTASVLFRQPVTRRCSAASSSSSGASTNADATTPSSSSTATVQYRGRALTVPVGTRLRTALLEAGLTPHNDRAQIINCRGLGTCGTCAVEVRGKVQPPSWTAAEQLRLNFPPHKAPNNERLRLACQVTLCEGDVSVIKYNRFWGQGDEAVPDVAEGEEGVRPPLGELEFVLDRTRRSSKMGGPGSV